MPFRVACPECDTQLKIPDDLDGSRVKCKRCGERFTARRANAVQAKADDDEAPPPRRGKSADESAARPRRPAEDDTDEGRRSGPAKRSTKPSGPGRTDEDEPRPKRSGRGKKKGGLPVALVLGLALGGLAVVGGGVGLVVYLTSGDPKTPDGGGAGGGGPAAAPASTAGWVEHRDPIGFRIKFPRTPTTATRREQDMTAREIDLTRHTLTDDGDSFEAWGTTLPEWVIKDDPPETALRTQANRFAGSVSGDPDNGRSFTVGGHPALEVTVFAPRGDYVVRMVMAGTRLILAAAGGKPGTSVTSPRVRAFLDSLTIE